MQNDNVFSGCIMLCLLNLHQDWHELVYQVCNEHKPNLIEPEWECHVTIGYGYHRDDIARLNKGDIKLPIRLGQILSEPKATFFESPEKKVVKFGISNTCPSYISLVQMRQETFKHCRCIETHPNYHPHITLGYFKPGTELNVELDSCIFQATYLKKSYINNEGVRVSCVI